MISGETQPFEETLTFGGKNLGFQMKAPEPVITSSAESRVTRGHQVSSDRFTLIHLSLGFVQEG